MKKDVVKALTHAIENRQPAVLATAVTVQGSSPTKPGSKILLLSDGSTIGTVGGGNLEKAVLEECRAAMRDDKPRLKSFSLTENGTDAVGMLCGGNVQVFIEPYTPPAHLLVIGGGHIGSVLRLFGETVGFEVSVVDITEDRATMPDFDRSQIEPNWYVVIITARHESDEDALRKVIYSPAAYVGMIGSRTKINAIFNHLRADGISEELLSRVHAPIGLDLGGPTPEEIALAVIAEIVAIKRGGNGGFLKKVSGG